MDGVAFEVRPGEIVGLVGPNGAAKTTTLRCVTGVIPATWGTIRVAGDPRAALLDERPRACSDFRYSRFSGSAFSEPTLVKLASGYEAFTQVRARNLPTFAPTVPSDHIAGTSVAPVRRPVTATTPRRADAVRRPHLL